MNGVVQFVKICREACCSGHQTTFCPHDHNGLIP
jgi:hypothetical protein